MTKPTLTFSQINTFKACPKKYFYKYILKLEPKRAEPQFIVGRAVHSALEGFHNGKDIIESYKTAIKAEWLEKNLTLDLKDEIMIQMTEILLKKYPDIYDDAENFSTISTELEFESKMLPDIDMRGKIDIVLRSRHNLNNIFLGEHKYYAQFNPDINTLLLDEQIKIYTLALMEHMKLKTPPMILYNVIKKPGFKMGKKETPTTFMERVKGEIEGDYKKYFIRPLPFVISQERLDIFIAELGYTIKTMLDLEPWGELGHDKFYYKCPRWDCVRLCSFCELCTCDSDKTIIESCYNKREKKNPELK